MFSLAQDGLTQRALGDRAWLLEGTCKSITLARNKVLSICSQALLARPGEAGNCRDSTWHLEEPALSLIWRKVFPGRSGWIWATYDPI